MVVWYTGTRGPVNRVERHDEDAMAELLPVVSPMAPRRTEPYQRAGFDWGTDTPRAVSLARALLADALGPEAARCDECNGTVRVVLVREEGYERDEPFDPSRAAEYDPLDVGQCVCEDGRRPLPVADFVADHVATWGPQWAISRREILAWLAGEYPEPPRWLTKTMTEVRLP